MATIVIGDVHGCREELDELLRLIEPARHRVVFVGDLIDRGPDSVGVVARVRELGAACIMGNHDDKAVRWARHAARATADATYVVPMRMSPERVAEQAGLSADDLAWMARLPHKLELGRGWWATHGGCEPRRRLRRQVPAVLMRCRWVDGAGMMMRQSDVRGLPPDGSAAEGRRGMIERPDGAFHWAELWPGPESVIYGHHVHGLTDAKIDRPVPGVTCVGLDTGCCYGGRLTAYVVETGEVIQVQARRAYAELAVRDDA